MGNFSPLAPPTPSKSQTWSGLPPSCQALAILSATQSQPGMHLAVTPDTQKAILLEQQLTAFAKGLENPPEILHFPDWETLPYDHFSPHEDIISDRLQVLSRIGNVTHGVLVVPITTLMHRLAPKEFVAVRCLQLTVGAPLEVNAFREQLNAAGYRCVDTVYEHGEYALRGSILDVYPMGSEWPLRIDFFDEDIDSIRTFDVDSQLTIDKIETFSLLPAKEFPLDDEGIRTFRNNWHSTFDVNHRQCPVYEDISRQISPAGVEYFIPLFFERMDGLLDYLKPETTLYLCGDLHTPASAFWQEVKSRFENLNVDPTRPLLEPAAIFEPVESVFARFKQAVAVTFNNEAANHTANLTGLPDLAGDVREEEPLQKLTEFCTEHSGKVMFCVDTLGRREVVLEQLKKAGVVPTYYDDFWGFLNDNELFGILVAPLDAGVLIHQDNDQALALICENDLFGLKVQQPRRRRKNATDNTDHIVKNLTELTLGAPVVHIDHGVGRYRGLETIELDNEANEFLTLEYANEAKLYVPVANLHLISRYSGADEALAPLHKLGTENWSKAKQKAADKARDVAAELLDIYARRAARQGHAFDDPGLAYEQFAASFPFEETPDQQQAIDAVRKDMLSQQPMDRLVCGDVGFGKTEVAMRSAFIAVTGGKQVAVLVPTTLLAQQHYDNFKDRFANWPVNIEVLSRFKNANELNHTLEQLNEGKVDIIIGTHKLIQKDVRYANLGLVIIDEEHRFGVRQKDQLKAIRSEVDVLALTATPIPRTLNLSIQGVRDLSIIATPPAKRLSVKTFVQEQKPSLIKEAILREVLRGGQVYYLHNEVKTIEKVARELQELLPEARVGIGHGQMRERELERVMSDFYHKRFDVLVCTTIIETGIDVPNANTIIIHRADKFGLAQLHQLRGRVGRSHHQAYAYLLTPPPKTITTDAVKRLEAISSATDLGAGFTLATHDLEIRGAGELLGDEQSGQIQHVGFSLYMDMLDRAVKSLKSGETPEKELRPSNTEVNLRVPALIPNDYLPDVHLRLTLYKRLASAQNDKALEALQVEMIDRFGLLPDNIKWLFRVTQLRIQAEAMGIEKLEGSAASIKIEFGAKPNVEPLTIVQLVQTQADTYKMSGANRLTMVAQSDSAEERLNHAEQLLERLSAS
ncbi:transcription-repair coupling factor [Marinibactrum halimedae]|uniref:Transcription-repair-coupling factor n=1 Tax=Marinibactrum halimedae TaxID=1444977 RepID=A0AA37T9F4_9GAMM|nr:transcription-repair coupling factor [Marinibactrum halimedae]MCD9459487.1 transcription-repair coupling factor [Marinibactrum halimedae]GLS28141.1 transcription-repair-coupling factor [Marinibactrum halimedae]